jgi:glycosyltransferase involved in cell wall biosynthesis
MTRVVFITQQFDPGHPLLATTIPQVAAIARQVDEVVVVADRIVESALPANARAHSFHASSRLGRGLRVVAAVVRELPGLRRERGAVVAHMCSLYALISAPAVRGARLPLVMWWSHWKISGVVRAAERACTAVCTVDPRTFPMASRKLVFIGQGIDLADIPAPARPPRAPDAPLRVLVGSRYSPAKGIATILRAARLALDGGVELRVTVHGPAVTGEERAEREALDRLVAELALEDRVTLGGVLPRGELLALFADADVLVNNARGGADRVAYEAAASGLLVLGSNPVYENLIDPEFFFAREDAAGLAARIAEVAALSADERDATGDRLRARVAERHSVDSWARGLLRAAGIEARPPAETAA